MIKRSLNMNMNMNKFQNLKFQKVDVIGSLDRWDQDETLDVGFI